MTFPLSRFMSTATATYGIYALVEPRHLGRVVTSRGKDQGSYDVLAQSLGVRDLAVSSLGLFGRSEKTVTASMVLRIILDVSDGVILSARADDEDARKMILGVTFGWAGLNALALAADRRRAKRSCTVTV